MLLFNTASFDLTQGCLSAAQVADIAKQGYSLASLVTVTVANNIDNPDVVFKDLANTVKIFYLILSFDLSKANIIQYN